LDHAITCEQRVAIEFFHVFLLFVLAVFMEDLCDEGKVDDRKSMDARLITNILKLEVTVTVANLVQNADLRDNLHAYVRNHLEVKYFLLICLLEALLDVERVKDVLPGVGHHNFTQRV
jgi:hypothetical protein